MGYFPSMFKLLSLLVFFQMSKIQLCLSLDIIRGDYDMFRSDISFDVSGASCNDDGYCRCDETDGYNTFIFNSNTSSGSCVKDQDIIEDRSEGKYIPGSAYGCLEVSTGGFLSDSFCLIDDLSVRWLWTKSEQLLNLKTLQCLKVEQERSLTIEQCDSRKSARRQRWKCQRFPFRNSPWYIKNEEKPFYRNWIRPNLRSSYITKCDDKSSYQGCYRFTAHEFMGLVKHSENCETSGGEDCDLQFKVLAPIDIQNHDCQIYWPNSKYSVDGRKWLPFQNDPGEFSLQFSSNNEKFLKIPNGTSLLSKWSGNLLRLEIQCSSKNSMESHCALLKIAGFSTVHIPTTTPVASSSRSTSTSSSTSSSTPSATPLSTSSLTSSSTSSSTLPTTSSSTLSMMSLFNQSNQMRLHTSNSSSTANAPIPTGVFTEYRTSTLSSDTDNNNNLGQIADESSSNLISFIVPAAVLCVFIVVVGIILFCRHRRRSIYKQDDVDLYAESKPSNDETKPISAQPGELQQFQVYENIKSQVNIAAEYDYPYNETVESNSQETSENDYDLTYDYATREETFSQLPEDSGDSNQRKMSPSSVQSSELPVNHLYQTVDDKARNIVQKSNEASGDRWSKTGLPSDMPLYHTLENPTEMTPNEEGVYEALNEESKSEPFYYVLEELK